MQLVPDGDPDRTDLSLLMVLSAALAPDVLEGLRRGQPRMAAIRGIAERARVPHSLSRISVAPKTPLLQGLLPRPPASVADDGEELTCLSEG